MTTDPSGQPQSEQSGLALRAAVAVEVMQWQPFPYALPPPEQYCYCPPGVAVHISNIKQLPPWESDRTAADQVICRMKELKLWESFLAEVAIAKELTERWLTVCGIEVGLELTAEEICQLSLAVIRDAAAERGKERGG